MHADPDLVFYDGSCGLCHAGVRFTALRDRAGRFVYAPLGGATFAARLSPERRSSFPDSVAVLTRTGRLHLRSRAVVHVLWTLGGGWRLVAGLLWLVPWFLRDTGYRGVAALRRRLFARPAGACPLVPSALHARFLS